MLKAQLLNNDEDDAEAEADANDMVDDENDQWASSDIKDYMLWTHVVKYFRKLAKSG